MSTPTTLYYTDNLTTPQASGYQMQKDAVLAAAVVEILIILVGTIGNLLTIVAVLRTKSLQYATNFLIVSLAVADFLVCTILVPMRATQHIMYQSDGKPPKAFVQVAGFVGRVNILASISTLVCLSVDRYIALSRPMRYATSIKFNTWKVSVAIATVWIVSVFITSVPKFPGVTDRPFLIFFIVFVLTSTLVIFVMYYHIFKIVAKSLRAKGKPIRYTNNFQKAAVAALNNKGRCVSDVEKKAVEVKSISTPPVSTVSPAETASQSAPQFAKEERKAAKTIGFVISAFIILVYPRLIMILYHFGSDTTANSTVGRFWARVLLYANSAINPLFYAYRHKGFRHAFRKMARQCFGVVQKRYDTLLRSNNTHSQTPVIQA